jgi:hypothetical protein
MNGINLFRVSLSPESMGALPFRLYFFRQERVSASEDSGLDKR